MKSPQQGIQIKQKQVSLRASVSAQMQLRASLQIVNNSKRKLEKAFEEAV